MASAVTIRDLTKSYGRIEALRGVSFDAQRGEIFGIIGPDGAGKTPLFRILTTLLLPDSGRATVDGLDVAADYKQIRRRVGYMPGRFSLYQDMSVEENLEMGAFSLKDQSDLKKDLDMVYGLFPRLKERRNQKAGTLSGGEQQMLAMGRALMSHPKTILMDEPSMGLSPKLVKEIFSIIRKLHEQGITILLVEQNAKMALSIADRAYVLETGRITMEGDAKELLNNEQVRKAYLGA